MQSVMLSNGKVLNLRMARAFDFARIVELFHRYLQPITDLEIAEHLSNRKGFIVGTVDGQVVAVCEGMPFSNSVIWCDMLVVDKDYRRFGVGKHLLDFFYNIVKEEGFDTFEAGVEEWNHHAIRFYKTNGYIFKNKRAVNGYFFIKLELNPDSTQLISKQGRLNMKKPNRIRKAFTLAFVKSITSVLRLRGVRTNLKRPFKQVVRPSSSAIGCTEARTA